MRKALAGTAVVVGSLLIPAAAFAQTTVPDDDEIENVVDDEDDEDDKTGLWGLLGLLGLAGLAGLKRRDTTQYRTTGSVAADTTPRGSSSTGH